LADKTAPETIPTRGVSVVETGLAIYGKIPASFSGVGAPL